MLAILLRARSQRSIRKRGKPALEIGMKYLSIVFLDVRYIIGKKIWPAVLGMFLKEINAKEVVETHFATARRGTRSEAALAGSY